MKKPATYRVVALMISLAVTTFMVDSLASYALPQASVLAAVEVPASV